MSFANVKSQWKNTVHNPLSSASATVRNNYNYQPLYRNHTGRLQNNNRRNFNGNMELIIGTIGMLMEILEMEISLENPKLLLNLPPNWRTYVRVLNVVYYVTGKGIKNLMEHLSLEWNHILLLYSRIIVTPTTADVKATIVHFLIEDFTWTGIRYN